MSERAAVWLVVLVVVTSAAGIGVIAPSQSATGPNNAEAENDGAGAIGVQSIQLVEQQRNVLRYAVEFSGSFDQPYLERSLVRAVDHDRIDASSIHVTSVESHIATIEVTTDGSENSQTVASRILRAMQLTTSQTQSATTSTTEDAPSTNASTGGNGKAKDTGQAEAYYQIDFVQGEPIKNLQGSEETYQPDELIRYAHGSTENLLKRSSNGEFTTNESLAECVESSAIVVKSNGTARVSFKIADGCDPVTLSLVSYTKPSPVWSRATESEQEFVDADTRTFEPGRTYTLRVELPPTEDSTTMAATSSESSATDRPETDTTTETEEAATDSEPNQTSTPTTTTVEVQPQPTPTLTPTSTPETSTSSAATSPDRETPGPSTSEGTAVSQGSSQQPETTNDPPAPSTPEPPTTAESDDSDGGSTPTDTLTDGSGDDSPSSATPTKSPTTTDDSDDGNDGGDQTPTTTTDPATEEPTTTDDGDDSTSTTTEPPETTSTTTETTAEPTTETPTTTEAPETTTTTTTEEPTTTTTTTKTTTGEPTETSTETTAEPTTEPPTTTESPETTTTTETDEPATEPPTTTETTATTTQPTTTTETTETTTTEEPTTTTGTTTEGPPEGGNSAEVLFNDQSLEESLRVVAEAVTLPTDSNGGFLVAYDAANFGEVDRPDDRIGVSEKLPSGTTESVQVDLQFGNASVSERVTVVAVRDSNGNGQYDPGVDTGALNEEGQIASDSAEVSIAVGLLPDPPDDGGDDNGSDGGTNSTTTTTTTTTSDGSGGDNESGGGGGILSSEATDAVEAESIEQNANATATTTTTDPTEGTDEEASTPENESMKTTVTKSST
jgi:hypothetical protein